MGSAVKSLPRKQAFVADWKNTAFLIFRNQSQVD